MTPLGFGRIQHVFTCGQNSPTQWTQSRSSTNILCILPMQLILQDFWGSGEAESCPWYLDADCWAIPFDNSEKSAWKLISRSLVPLQRLNLIKESPVECSEESAEMMEKIVCGKVVSINRTRKSKASQRPPGKRTSSGREGKKPKRIHSLIMLL